MHFQIDCWEATEDSIGIGTLLGRADAAIFADCTPQNFTWAVKHGLRAYRFSREGKARANWFFHVDDLERAFPDGPGAGAIAEGRYREWYEEHIVNKAKPRK